MKANPARPVIRALRPCDNRQSLAPRRTFLGVNLPVGTGSGASLGKGLGAGVALASLLATACVPQVEAPGGGRHGHRPLPRPAPQYEQASPSAPVAPVSQDWRDAPRTAGDWTWSPTGGGTRASYVNSAGGSLFSLTCNRPARTVVLMRPAPITTTATMQISTTYGTRSFTASPVAGGVAVTLTANDPQLDAMAFSRGRFAIYTSSTPTLYVPSWAEVGRVIEDCR